MREFLKRHEDEFVGSLIVVGFTVMVVGLAKIVSNWLYESNTDAMIQFIVNCRSIAELTEAQCKALYALAHR